MVFLVQSFLQIMTRRVSPLVVLGSRHRLCLRCAKYVEHKPTHHCLYNQESSKKCERCCSQKSKCFPTGTFILIVFCILSESRVLRIWLPRGFVCCGTKVNTKVVQLPSFAKRTCNTLAKANYKALKAVVSKI
jgi:hypothetical protein